MNENIKFVTKVNKKYSQKKLYDLITYFLVNEDPTDEDKINLIKNFCGLLCEKYNIDGFNVYIDTVLADEKINKLNVAAYHLTGNIFLNEYLFCEKEELVSSLKILAHEFMHLFIYERNKNLNRKIGKNEKNYIYSFNEATLDNLGLGDPEIIKVLYFSNKNEFFAEQFSYKFLIDLLEDYCLKAPKFEDLMTIITETLNLIRNKEESKKLYFESKKLARTYENSVRINQEFLFHDYQEKILDELLIGQANSFKNKFAILKVLNIRNTILDSFFIYENKNLFERMKDYTLIYAPKHPFLTETYKELLGEPNFVVTKEELKNLISLCKKQNLSLKLDELNLNKKNLIENILEIELGEFDKSFMNGDLSSVKTYKQIISAYDKFLVQKLEANNNIETSKSKKKTSSENSNKSNKKKEKETEKSKKKTSKDTKKEEKKVLKEQKSIEKENKKKNKKDTPKKTDTPNKNINKDKEF